MEMTAVESQHLKAIGYNGITLRVEFKSGAVWNYDGVPDWKHKGLMESPSKGRYFRREIKGHYQATKVSG